MTGVRTPVSATARTMSVRRRRPQAGAVLLVVLAVGVSLTLAACGRAGAAAVVNDRTISVTEVQEATRSLQAADPTSFAKVTPVQVLSILMIGPFAEQAASAAGQGVSDDVVRQALQSSAQQSGDTAVHLDKLNADALAALRGEVALSQLDQASQQKVLQDIKTAKISVSPRYGTFDRTRGSITAVTPNWMQAPAKPAPTASPTATG
jgi:hypothetical protein